MDNSVVLVALGFVVFIGIGIGCLLVIRKRYFEEQAVMATKTMYLVADGFFLCGIPFKRWLTKSIPARSIRCHVADYSRAVGELLTYALYMYDSTTYVYYKKTSEGYYDVILRFGYEGELWQHRILDGASLVTRVPRNRFQYGKDIEGYLQMDHIVPWMKRFQEKWETCRDLEASKDIAPDAIYLDDTWTSEFDWNEYRDKIRKQIVAASNTLE